MSSSKSPVAMNSGFFFTGENTNGETIHHCSSGPHINEDSFMWVASGGKIVINIAYMIAVERGLLCLDDPAGKWLPELEDPDIVVGIDEENEKPILRKARKTLTLRHLLSHTSGFAYQSYHPRLLKYAMYTGKVPDDLTGDIQCYNHPLVFEPGEGWAYGPGVDWAGRALERASHQCLESFCKENIWIPLNTPNTTYRPTSRPDLMARRLKLVHARKPQSAPGTNKFVLQPKDDLAGVGLWSTPRDFNKFLSLCLRKGGGLLRAESVEEIFKPEMDDAGVFMDQVYNVGLGILGSGYPKGHPLKPGFSACLNMADLPGRRARGSASWVGIPNVYWWIDWQRGVFGCMYMQTLPTATPEIEKLLVQQELAFYKELRRQRRKSVTALSNL